MWRQPADGSERNSLTVEPAQTNRLGIRAILESRGFAGPSNRLLHPHQNYPSSHFPQLFSKKRGFESATRFGPKGVPRLPLG